MALASEDRQQLREWQRAQRDQAAETHRLLGLILVELRTKGRAE